MTEISQRDNISKPTFDTESKAHKESLNTKEPWNITDSRIDFEAAYRANIEHRKSEDTRIKYPVPDSMASDRDLREQITKQPERDSDNFCAKIEEWFQNSREEINNNIQNTDGIILTIDQKKQIGDKLSIMSTSLTTELSAIDARTMGADSYKKQVLAINEKYQKVVEEIAGEVSGMKYGAIGDKDRADKKLLMKVSESFNSPFKEMLRLAELGSRNTELARITKVQELAAANLKKEGYEKEKNPPENLFKWIYPEGIVASK